MSKTGTATSPPREGEPVETAINIEVNQSTRDQSKSAKILTVTGRLFMEMTSLCSFPTLGADEDKMPRMTSEWLVCWFDDLSKYSITLN